MNRFNQVIRYFLAVNGELLADDELIGGIEYEDEFYTQLLDKMVINDRENIDVYLNLLPLKWRKESAHKCGVMRRDWNSP